MILKYFSRYLPKRFLKYLLIYCLILLALGSIFVIFPAFGNDGIDKETCTYKGQKLYGKVLVVESFPDLTIKVTSSFPDLNVELVNSFPNSCGQWQFVESFPDLKVKFVTSFPDITIKFVDSFPGLR